jgi:serine/threonine protein kinase
MEYMRRGTLEHCIDVLSYKEKSAVIVSAVLAVKYAHGRGIVHGGLRPSKIPLDTPFHVKLTDFAIAPGMQQLGVLKFPPAYAAPESLLEGVATWESDVFCLASVIHFVATSKAWWPPKATKRLVVEAIYAGQRPSLPACMPEVLVDAVKRMWHASPGGRPPLTEAWVVLEALKYCCFSRVDEGKVGELLKGAMDTTDVDRLRAVDALGAAMARCRNLREEVVRARGDCDAVLGELAAVVEQRREVEREIEGVGAEVSELMGGRCIAVVEREDFGLAPGGEQGSSCWVHCRGQ